MRAVIQRVSQANVSIDSKIIGKINRGYLLLLGVEINDTKEDAEWLANKIVQMRLFADEAGKMNLSLQEVEGEVLIVSQFTLYAKYKKGNRPSFIHAARPEQAIPLYEHFIKQFEKKNIHTTTGEFGADMQVSLINNGPVTILIDTKNKE